MKRKIALAVLALALASIAFEYRSQLMAWSQGTIRSLAGQRPLGEAAASPGVRTTNQLVASGTVEAHTISVSSPNAGRLRSIQVAEGDRVAAGDMIAEMDPTLVDAQILQAQAAVAQAKAQVALLKAGARPADVEVARAAVRQAEAARNAAKTAWDDAQAAISAPGQLDVQIASGTAALGATQQQLAIAQANAAAADLQNGLWARTVQLMVDGVDWSKDVPNPYNPSQKINVSGHAATPAWAINPAKEQWDLSSQKTWQAYAQSAIVGTQVSAAQQLLDDLQDQKNRPLMLEAQANSAGAAYETAKAQVTKAESDLGVVLAGAQEERIQAAEAQVRQAQAAVKALQVRRDQAHITAPQAGTVTRLVVREGEVVAAGGPIIQLADVNELTLTVYVPETQMGQVHLEQAAAVVVDSFPGRSFRGKVTQIANVAEFTPKNVQTSEDRANTVFAVKLNLQDGGGALKAGMPADAYFCAGAQAQCAAQSSTTDNVITTGLGQNLPAVASRLESLTGSRESTGVTPVTASGVVEGTETDISAEMGARIVAINVDEGDKVGKGQVLVQLDTSELNAQHEQALAAVAAAQEQMALVKAPARASDIARAQAQVGQAEVSLLAAHTALTDSLKLRQNPQELDAQIDSAKEQVETATGQIDLARAKLREAQVAQQGLPDGNGSDETKTKRAVADQQVAAGEAAVRAAEIQQQGAQAVLAQLQAIRQRPVALDTAVHKAQGLVNQAAAGLDTAHALLAQVQAPAQPQAVDVAQAQVEQAQAAAALLEATIAKLEISSPVTGTVTSRIAHPGEVAQPAQTLLKLVDLSRVKLVVYVPAGRIGQVKAGQQARVTLDAYPDRTFTGTVTHINDEAEFTPKNVQTQEERVKTVFRVEITLDNTDGLLKPGMPGDAVSE